MKAIIFSHEHGGSYVMDRDGCFRFVRGHSTMPIGTEIDIREQQPVSLMRIASAAACFVLIISISIFTWLWNVTDYYVYVDINPSVELQFNGLGRLRNTVPLNDDASLLLSGVDLKGYVEEVVVTLIDEAVQKNFLSAHDGEPNVLITVVAARGGSPDTLLSAINAALKEHGMLDYTVVEVGSMELREKAEGLGVSPGRLKLAEALLREDGLHMTLEELLRIPVGELYAAIHNPDGTVNSTMSAGGDPNTDSSNTRPPATDAGGDGGSGQTAGGGGESDSLPATDPLDNDPNAAGQGATGTGTAGRRSTGSGTTGPQGADQSNTSNTSNTSHTGLQDIDPPGAEPADVGLTDDGSLDNDQQNPGSQDSNQQNPGSQNPGSTNPGTQNPGPTNPGTQDPDPTDPGTQDPDPNDPATQDPDPTDPGAHEEDCDCEICIGESGEGFGATVYALVKGSGNTRNVAITVIDTFGQYSQTFGYTNGTVDGNYTIEGEYLIYNVYIVFAGNTVQTVLITGYETVEGDAFDAGVIASVEGNGSNRKIVITVTDSGGDYEKTFSYTNGTACEVYIVEGAEREYKVYIIYQGNSVWEAMIIDYEDVDTGVKNITID